jgi:tRNA A-37 threonylcarbamoyl transferase component Bud32
MPVSLLRRLPPFRPAAGSWCVLRPDRRTWLECHGLGSARDFLALPGVVVSGHVGRNVSRVRIGPTTAYLKREHRVRIRDRFRSWQDGFGWSSMSAREATVLRQLEERGLPGPTWLAYGEAAAEAFLLLEAAGEAVELRAIPSVGPELAERLGRILARLHAAGIDQPDLFAKHILVRPDSGNVTILDWQRARRRRQVSWRDRIGGLGALRATAPETLLAVWDQLLCGYFAEGHASAKAAPGPDELSRAVARRADELARRPGIRSQRTPVAAGLSQELVRIGGETVCAIPAVAGELGSADAIDSLYRPAHDGHRVPFAGRRSGVLRVRRYSSPFGRLWAALRGRAWRSSELKLARLLFHLERHEIPAPKLLAYGQKVPRLRPAGSFVLYEPQSVRAPQSQDAGLIRQLLDRLHSAGCSLRDLGPAGEPFGIASDTAVVTDGSLLRLDRRLSARRMRRDLARLDAFFKGR